MPGGSSGTWEGQLNPVRVGLDGEAAWRDTAEGTFEGHLGVSWLKG